MTFGRLRKIFCWKKSYTKCGGETSSKSFYKNSKIEHISESTLLNFLKFVFIVCPSVGLPKYTKTEVLTTCFDLM